MTTGLSNADFKKAAEDVKTLSNKPDNATLLKVRTAGGFHPAYKCAYSSKLYALFKQATVGDNETEAPGMMDFTGKAKWNAWNDVKGLSQDDATHQYIGLANDLVAAD
ncbi:hypothetical protein NQ176_g7552 [Zarea fungicola]|uniref:Uncharacterized protein n=1 Tax=Zarea fungicola TaxID=93591 RepID=A0ACC1MZA7_9HYPO|nr:hypothetical protein NQ176_g7552 [Lecanicillium fungicola]